DRDFSPTYSQTEWNHAYVDMQRIYLVTLAKATRHPFAPKSDEVGEKGDKSDKGDKPSSAENDKKEPVAVKVDVDGLRDRVVALPVQASSYQHLTSTSAGLHYLRHGTKDAQT